VGTGTGSLDANSRHIQRGRDVGLCGINTVRANLPEPLPAYSSWSDLTDDEFLIEDLTELYGDNPDDADLWVSGIIENHVQGSNLVFPTHIILPVLIFPAQIILTVLAFPAQIILTVLVFFTLIILTVLVFPRGTPGRPSSRIFLSASATPTGCGSRTPNTQTRS
jgi:hypothetical protein